MTEHDEKWYSPTPSAPRYDAKNPGELAKLESKWLADKKGVKVTPAQVRAVLMYHTEFQRSPERAEQRTAAAAERAAAKAAKPKRVAKKAAAPKKSEVSPASATATLDKAVKSARRKPAAKKIAARRKSADTPSTGDKPRRQRAVRRQKPVAAAKEMSF